VLGVLYDNHGGTITQKNTLTTWQDASVETEGSLCTHDVACASSSCVTHSLSFSLCHVFENLEGPDDPEADHS